MLGRGADDDKVDHWLRQGAPVEGYAGFAIGRTIWWDALKGFLDGDLEREDAAQQIADNYLRFVQVYQEAAQGARDGVSLQGPEARARAPNTAGSLPPAHADAAVAGAVRGGLPRGGGRVDRAPGAAPQGVRSALPRPPRASARARQGKFRFALLALTLVATAVIVTIVMFETLAMLAG